jgi:hypothetical protein
MSTGPDKGNCFSHNNNNHFSFFPISPVLFAVLAGRDVAGYVSQYPTGVFHYGNGLVLQQRDQEGERVVHGTDVGLEQRKERGAILGQALSPNTYMWHAFSPGS